MKLLEYKKRILVREFNFLAKVLESKNLSIDMVDSIKVKKIDENLLGMVGEYRESDFPYSGNYYSLQESRYFAIYGEEIKDVPVSGSYEAQYVYEKFKADAIGEELLKIGGTPDFIVLLERNFSSSGGMDGENDFFNVIIFKAHSFDMMAYHSSQFHKAAEALEVEMRSENMG